MNTDPRGWLFDGISSASCVSESFCVAISGFNALRFVNGGWLVPEHFTSYAGSNEGGTCASTTFCVAFEDSEVWTYNGASWSAYSIIEPINGGKGARLISVSCPTISFCVAVDDSGNALTYNGSSWSAPNNIDAGQGFFSVSCPTMSFCVALDGSGNALKYNGSSWSTPTKMDNTSGYVTSVSCPTVSFCMAVDDAGNAFAYSASTTTTTTTTTTVTGPTSPTGASIVSTKTDLSLSKSNVTHGHEGTVRASVVVVPRSSGPAISGMVRVRAVFSLWGNVNVGLCVIKLSRGRGSCNLPASALNPMTFRGFLGYGSLAAYDYEITAHFLGSTRYRPSTSQQKMLFVS